MVKLFSYLKGKNRNRYIMIGSIVVIIIVIGYFLIPKPASVLVTSTNTIVSSAWFTTEISYDTEPIDLKRDTQVDSLIIDYLPVFSGTPSTMTFTFTIMAKKPYGSDIYNHLDWINLYMSPIIQSFDTGYLTQEFEWGAPQVDSSTTIYYQFKAQIPNKAGIWYFIWQGSTVEAGSTYAGANKWYFELTGSSVLDPLTNSAWSEVEKSSTKIVDFKGGLPIGAEEETIPLGATTTEETTTENGNDNGNGNGEATPSFEWSIILMALFIGVKYVKKRHSED